MKILIYLIFFIFKKNIFLSIKIVGESIVAGGGINL